MIPYKATHSHDELKQEDFEDLPLYDDDGRILTQVTSVAKPIEPSITAKPQTNYHNISPRSDEKPNISVNFSPEAKAQFR